MFHGNSKKMFSVVIPYYKKRKYIERCIDAVLSQTCQDFEIILVDDGSQDDIAELIEEKYLGKISLIQQENKGVSAARNTGIKNSINDYVCFLDADDVWHYRYLEFAKHVIDNNRDIKIIGAQYTRDKAALEVDNEIITYKQINNYFKVALKNTLFTSSSSIVNKFFFENNEGFNPLLKVGEDLDVWFRVILSDGNAYFIDNRLIYYSDEDINQVTNKITEPSTSLLFNLPELELNFYSKFQNEEFARYLSKLKYQGLRYHFFQNATHHLAKKVLESRKERYFLADLYYFLPFSFGNKLNQNLSFRRYSRTFFKFLFRYIYK